jgi:selenocysteine lyase/cysteine desulfurase
MDAIDFQNEIGKDKIEKRVLALHKYAKEKIVANWGEQALYSPMDEELSTGLVSFNPFDDHYGEYGHQVYDNISTLYSGLQDQDIITRTIGFYNKLADTQATRVLRISTHIYNDFRQIDTAIDTAKDIVESIQSSG